MALGKHILFDELGLCLVEHSKISPRLGWSILNIGIFADEYESIPYEGQSKTEGGY